MFKNQYIALIPITEKYKIPEELYLAKSEEETLEILKQAIKTDSNVKIK